MIENHIPEVIGSSLLTLGGIAVWLRKQRVALAQDNASVAVQESNANAHEAVQTVIELLRSEVSRLSATNTDLSNRIVGYQNASVQLQSEVSILKARNESMAGELTELRRHIAKLSDKMKHLKDCSLCPYTKIDLPI